MAKSNWNSGNPDNQDGWAKLRPGRDPISGKVMPQEGGGNSLDRALNTNPNSPTRNPAGGVGTRRDT